MGGFSTFHSIFTLLALAIFAVPVFLAVSSARKKPEQGFAGWLMLLAIGQTLFLIQSVLSTIQILPLPGTYDASVKGATIAYGVETALYLVALAIVIATTVCMFKRRRTFPAWFTVQWAATFLLVVLDVAWVATWFNMSLASAWVEFNRDLIAAGIMAALGAVWVGYVWRSRRVKNTFAH
ncbi:DUF2569 family protein [Tianweitania sp.]|uniref:DUF2569 family protein n=1 Tax=Tianweitania sp. TaxID=2021634 RepID=UPI00289C7158|nr:DUF2569 family protein [Tianweitania sp.]